MSISIEHIVQQPPARDFTYTSTELCVAMQSCVDRISSLFVLLLSQQLAIHANSSWYLSGVNWLKPVRSRSTYVEHHICCFLV